MMESRQLNLLELDEYDDGEEGRLSYRNHLVFKEPDRSQMYMGMQHLNDYLKEGGILAPLVAAKILDEQDWKPFEVRYRRGGRAPYAPRLMMGLILYGLMRGIDTLRGLEEVARTDLGCMWVTAGIKPDNSVIGRFIVLHKDQIGGLIFPSFRRHPDKQVDIIPARGVR